ncbi:MAG: pro-sigmaK processing inhibitor BofA [Bacilli bacterium]|nr:pro-sigmaK processing inhibitor BofA [Bacilli bacterium]
MGLFWWSLFIVSICLLILTLLRNKYSFQWLGVVGMNLVIAAVLLYLINWLGAFYDFHIAINVSTISTIGILGIPGLLLLIALKLTLF